jgi:hypothetical protein
MHLLKLLDGFKLLELVAGRFPHGLSVSVASWLHSSYRGGVIRVAGTCSRCSEHTTTKTYLLLIVEHHLLNHSSCLPIQV